MIEMEAFEKSHKEVVESRRKALATHRAPVRHGERYGYLLTGAHPTFNMQEEVDMQSDPKRGISRVEEVFVRTKKRGRVVIENFTLDGRVEAYPNTNDERRDELKNKKICGQEILVFLAFVPQVLLDNVHNYPESNIPDEFTRMQTEQLLKEEL